MNRINRQHQNFHTIMIIHRILWQKNKVSKLMQYYYRFTIVFALHKIFLVIIGTYMFDQNKLL